MRASRLPRSVPNPIASLIDLTDSYADKYGAAAIVQLNTDQCTAQNHERTRSGHLLTKELTVPRDTHLQALFAPVCTLSNPTKLRLAAVLYGARGVLGHTPGPLSRVELHG